MKKRNVVLITIDECKASAMSAYGNRFVDTPGTDYAKENGVMFENSFVCMPKCVPSRCSLMSGRYVHTNGHRTLPGFELAKDEITLAGLLKEQGYKTAMFGKNHTVEEAFKPQLFDYYTKEQQSPASLIKKDTTLNLNDPLWKAFYRGDWKDHFDDEHEDFYAVEDSLEFMRKNKDQPFFLLINLSLPHPVYYGMSPFIEKIRTLGVKAPEIEKIEDATKILQMYRKTYDVEELTDDDRKKIVESYYSMVSYVDHLVLKIYQEIENLYIKDNTIVIYTSDHGDFAGEHGAYEKFDTFFYDCLIKVPLFIQCPGLLKSRKLDSMIENVDIMPTILHMLEMDIPNQLHGKSALDYMTGKKKNHKDYVFCEGGVETEAILRAPHYDSELCKRMLPNYYLKQKVIIDNPVTMEKAKMVRTDKWKLIYRLNGYKELYDLKHDPNETKNIAEENKDIVSELMEKILDWCIRTETDSPVIENLYA